MERNGETWSAVAKGALAWIGLLLGHITLSDLVMAATLIFTSLQTFVLVRDKIIRRGV